MNGVKAFAALGLGLVCVAFNAQARQILCPGSFHFVNTGDDVATVIKTCGPPKRRVDKTSQNAQENQPTYWYYYGQGNSFVVHNTILKFVAGKLTSMVVSGSPASSFSCINGSVGVGASKAMVRQKCGFPVATANQQQLQSSQSFQSVGDTQQRQQRFNSLNLLPQFGKNSQTRQSPQQHARNEAKKSHKFTVLIYQPESYMPKTAFMFIDDRLTQSGVVAENKQ